MFSKVYVEITNTCNMNCSFCHGTKRPPKMMTKNEFEAVIQKLRPYTNYIYYHLMGEPLTHPELEDFIALASSYGYKSVITTNGSLLKQKGDILLRQSVYKVSVSLHSFENGTENDFKRYLSEVADFSQAAVKNGTIVVLRLWNNGCDGGKNADILDFLKSAIAGEWAENTKGLRIKKRLFLEYGDRFGWPDSNAERLSDRVFCYGLKDHFGILSNGTVVPCCLDSDGCIGLGNIFSDSIESILKGDRAASMVKGFEKKEATEELCKRCSYAHHFKL